MLPHLGVQNDEAIFVTPLYHWREAFYTLRIGHSHIPLMLMSYLGALKVWIYKPIFRLFGANVWTLREPMLLAGAASIWLFFQVLRRVAGERAAWIGCALLAVDSMYLLTSCFDWGPVAMQHLLLAAGILQLTKFYHEGKNLPLAGGCFLLGLAMFDKALAVWMLSGIAVAAAATIPRQIWAVITRERVTLAVSAFLFGMLPLIVYNVATHGETFKGNFHPDPREISQKVEILRLTTEGDGLFGYMVAEKWQTAHPRLPQGLIQEASARISALAGYPRRDLMKYALLLAVLLAPLAGRDALRAVLFALIALAVAWLQMAMTQGAGGSIHHSILLWPLPQAIVAISFAGVSQRLGRAGIPAVATVVAVLLVSALLVMNQYYYAMVRNGGAQAWTDAIVPLSDFLKRAPATNVYCVDWGIFDGLSLLNAGKLPLRVGSSPIDRPELSPDDRQAVVQMISEPGAVFLTHTKDFEFFQGVNEKLVKFAADAGYRRDMLTVICDGNQRPTFEVYRFAAEE